MGQPALPRAHPCPTAYSLAHAQDQFAHSRAQHLNIRPLVLDARPGARVCAHLPGDCVRGWLLRVLTSETETVNRTATRVSERERDVGRVERAREGSCQPASQRRREKLEQREGESEKETERKGREEGWVSLELSCRRMRALRLAAEGEARQRLLIHQDPPTNPR